MISIFLTFCGQLYTLNNSASNFPPKQDIWTKLDEVFSCQGIVSVRQPVISVLRFSIHPCSSIFRVVIGLEPVPAVLDRSPVYRRTERHMHTLTARVNFLIPVNLTCMALDCGSKPENLNRIHTDTGLYQVKFMDSVWFLILFSVCLLCLWKHQVK